MQTLDDLQKETEQKFVQNLHTLIKSSPDSDISIILLNKAKDNKCFLNSLQNRLNIPKEELDKNVEYLVKNEIISIVNHGRINLEYKGDTLEVVVRGDLRKHFALNSFFGPYHIIQKKELDESIVLKAMNSIKDIVNFSYRKRFSFDNSFLLGQLKEKSDKIFKEIEKDVKEFWYTQHNIPRQYNGYFPSFISENNIEQRGYSLNNWNLYGKFSSPEEAFKIEFDTAIGYPITSYPYEEYPGKIIDGFPKIIDINKTKKGYDLFIDNICYEVYYNYDGSLNYIKESKEVMKTIKERIEKVLS